MNAGRDVERLIATWLVEEAPARAPDRVLDDAAARIDRTKQRRFTAAWREPMIISTGRLLATAAVVVLAVVSAGWIGRASAPAVGGSGPSLLPPPSAEPSPTASTGPTVASYRAARDAICQAANPIDQPLKDALPGVYDPALSEAKRSAKIDALAQIVVQAQLLHDQLAALAVPPELASEHAASLARNEDVQSILQQEVQLLHAGKLSEAQQLDLTTDPINRRAEQFEQKYGLSPCP